MQPISLQLICRSQQASLQVPGTWRVDYLEDFNSGGYSDWLLLEDDVLDASTLLRVEAINGSKLEVGGCRVEYSLVFLNQTLLNISYHVQNSRGYCRRILAICS